MGLADIIRTGVAVANKVTSSLQANVTLQHYTANPPSSDDYGKKTYPLTTTLRAIVDWKQKQLRTGGGILSVSRAMVMFLDIDALVKATNGEGINDEDRITLPDGTTGPILDMAGFIDAGTGHPFATEVYLG